MGWRVGLDEQQQLVEVVFSGVQTGEDIRAATQDAIELSRSSGIERCLIDASRQKKTATITELFDLPRQYTAAGASRAIRVALVMPEDRELRDVAKFYENVCVNRGWQVRTVPTRDAAIEWLAAKEPQSH